jgi:hypothetical protein
LFVAIFVSVSGDTTMPKDKYAGTDPDPRPFLYVSPEQKRADQVLKGF